MAKDKLAIRPPVLEGEYIDPQQVRDIEEGKRNIEQHGLVGGIMITLNRRLQREIERQFLTGR